MSLMEFFIQSPVGLVPKGTNGTRLIFHLSYPRDGKSVNSETPKHLCSVSYKDIDFAIKMCKQEGEGCFVAKSDMQSAFHTNLTRRLEMATKDGQKPHHTKETVFCRQVSPIWE